MLLCFFGIVVGESLVDKGEEEEGQRDWVFREKSLATHVGALVPFQILNVTRVALHL
jgi:hypothetical protein